MQEIHLKNTLTGKKEKLTPIEPGHIKLYACGVTVYDDCHIGHAMQAVYFEVIRTYLEFCGYKVTYVRNYTDVDDKIIEKAAKLGISPKKLAEDVIASSIRDMKSLGLRPATHEPKVSESIPQIISMIETLIKKKNAYATKSGDVYYRVHSKNDYGKLSNRKVDELRAGTRKIAEGDKENEMDFALWKQDDTVDASWTSPWGTGRPGWHIECSAMSKEYLGSTFDIHGGGRDLIFPHHENEIAQSESANGCTYANYWIHSGLMTIDKRKMSKSIGNHITISDFIKNWPAEVLKLAYFERHYGSNIDFSNRVFQDSRRRLLCFYETLESLQELGHNNPAGTTLDDKANTKQSFLGGYSPEGFLEKFHKAMSDDFNTSQAMAELGSLFKLANVLLKKKASSAQYETAAAMTMQIKEIGAVLGLFYHPPSQFISDLKRQVLPELGISESEILVLIEKRAQARDEKNWGESDSIRDQLLEKCIELRDTAGETLWTIARKIEN